MKTYYEKENVKLFQGIFLYWRHGENSLHILISPVLLHLLKYATRKFKVTYVAHIVSTGHCYLDIYLHFLSFKTALAFESLTYLELIFIFGSEVRTNFNYFLTNDQLFPSPLTEQFTSLPTDLTCRRSLIAKQHIAHNQFLYSVSLNWSNCQPKYYTISIIIASN